MSTKPSSSALIGLNALSPTATRVELMRLIWALAWPAIMTFGLESLVGLIDALMVGRLGASAVAGVGVGTQILNFVSVMNMALATGTVALVARAVGANDHDHAEAVLVQSLYSAVVLGLVIALPVYRWAPELVGIFKVDAQVIEAGTGFVRMIMLGVPAMVIFAVIAAGLRGAGDMRTPLLIGGLVNVVNVCAAYVLIFGKLGLPALGVRGAALASALAFNVGMLLAIASLLRPTSALRLRHAHLTPHLGLTRRLAAVGLPTGLEQLLMQFGFLLYLGIAARYGTPAVAAYFIGVRILALSFLPGFGFSAAASTIVGQQLGARQPEAAERSGWAANRLAMMAMSVAGLLIFIFARPIAALFIDDAEVIDDAVSFIRVLALAQPLMAADSTLGGALRGAGDTRFPLLTVVLGFYGARLGFAWAAAYLFGLSLTWVWAALLGDYVLRAGLKAWRFNSGRWQRIHV
ncbi:MAG: MATE family efflux transporter [Candidatus Binatia bacterium]